MIKFKLKSNSQFFRLELLVKTVIEWCEKNSEPLWIITSKQEENLYHGYKVGKDVQICIWKQMPESTHAYILDFTNCDHSINKNLELIIHPNVLFMRYFNKH